MRLYVRWADAAMRRQVVAVEASGAEAAIADVIHNADSKGRGSIDMGSGPIEAGLVPELGGVDLTAGCGLEFVQSGTTRAGVPSAPGDLAVVRDADVHDGVVMVLLLHRSGSVRPGDVPRELEAPEWVSLAWLAQVARVGPAVS